MKIQILLLLLFFCIKTEAQELVLSKEKVAGISEIQGRVSPQLKNTVLSRVNKANARTDGRKSIFVQGNKEVTLNENEAYFSYSDGYLYTTKFEVDAGVQKIVKYKDNSQISSKTFPLEGSLDHLSDGSFYFLDYAHGYGDTYSFYSGEFQPINDYTPSEGGFEFTVSDINENEVVIVTKTSIQSQTARIALLDHNGNLKISKDLAIGDYSISNVKLLGNTISLLCSSNSAFSAKLLLFDATLRLKWEKELNDRVVNNEVIEDPTNNHIAIIKTESIESLSVDDGRLSWRINRDTKEAAPGFQTISARYVLSGGYFAIVTGRTSNNESAVHNNRLRLFDTNSGKLVYNDSVGDSGIKIRILSEGEQFFIINDKETINYKRR